MHAQARAYAASKLVGRHFPTVVEIGSRFINGGVGDLFSAKSYTGLDLEAGPGVDVVVDALDWAPPAPVDLVVCCEVLEHEPRQREMVLRAAGWLRPGGELLITAGGPGRAPHSGHDGAGLRAGEAYGNVDPDDLASWFRDAGMAPAEVAYAAGPCDVYGWAVAP